MPNITSAKKRLRQASKATLRNRVRKERLRKAIKSFKTVLASGDEAAIREGVKTVTKAVDKAGVKGIMHKNAVSRKKAQMAKAANVALAK